MSASLNPQSISCGLLANEVAQRQKTLAELGAQPRFWAKDPTLWGDERATGVAPWLGWIDAVQKMRGRVHEIESFVAEVKADGFKRVVLCGMGGSSLAPLVFSSCIADGEGLPLHVLDLTNPASVLEAECLGPVSESLFIISSKSGTTAEPVAFDNYFWDCVQDGSNFVAITDPGNPFEASANVREFRKVFLNFPDIGGRFSALSYFGLVPAALLGLDLNRLLDAAEMVVTSSGPAIELGAALGEFALHGRNKATFVLSEDLYPLGLWFEQLIAESTGKLGRGILPVAGEWVTKPASYGPDRVFAHIHFSSDSTLMGTVDSLRSANHPVVAIELTDSYSIAQEMMRWEIATAIVGVVLEINPFDQPNVQESKDITKKYVQALEQNGKLPSSSTGAIDGPLTWHGDSDSTDAGKIWKEFLKGFGPNDFVAVMAFLPDRPDVAAELRKIQNRVRDTYKCATTMGFGPRFLHSTGQFHKGGPNNGFFVQVTSGHPADAPIPGQKITWGQFVDAQAAGDLEALQVKGRRTLRIHVNGDLVSGLQHLYSVVEGIGLESE